MACCQIRIKQDPKQQWRITSEALMEISCICIEIWRYTIKNAMGFSAEIQPQNLFLRPEIVFKWQWANEFNI